MLLALRLAIDIDGVTVLSGEGVTVRAAVSDVLPSPDSVTL
jgi:hypothetical protein